MITRALLERAKGYAATSLEQFHAHRETFLRDEDKELLAAVVANALAEFANDESRRLRRCVEHLAKNIDPEAPGSSGLLDYAESALEVQ